MNLAVVPQSLKLSVKLRPLVLGKISARANLVTCQGDMDFLTFFTFKESRRGARPIQFSVPRTFGSTTIIYGDEVSRTSAW